MVQHPFSGSALGRIDGGGRIRLPIFVRDTLNRRGAAASLLIGCHEIDPCLIAYDPAFAAAIFADVERRRLSELDAAPHLHHARARRAFGFVAAAEVDGETVTLPPIMRRRARLGEMALLVGAGGTFEIWDAAVALEDGDPDLRELADFHLHAKQAA